MEPVGVGCVFNASAVHPASCELETRQLEGTNVLVVEDEALIAMDLADRLSEAGARIVGPCSSVSEALECLGTADIDVAVIDFVLKDHNSDALQEALEEKRVPFVVVTSYPRALVRREHGQTVLSKPVPTDLLCSAVRAVRDRG